MHWNDATWWWLLAGVLVAAELATGTFYLLMLALGVATGAIAAHLGAPLTLQIVVAAVLGIGGLLILNSVRRRRPRQAPARSNRNVNLDIGERVNVAYWDADGSTQVSYRGANWQARWQGTGIPEPGEHVIRAIDGNRLMLDKQSDKPLGK